MSLLGSESKITADGGVIMLSELGLAEGSFVPLSGRPPLTRRGGNSGRVDRAVSALCCQ